MARLQDLQSLRRMDTECRWLRLNIAFSLRRDGRLLRAKKPNHTCAGHQDERARIPLGASFIHHINPLGVHSRGGVQTHGVGIRTSIVEALRMVEHSLPALEANVDSDQFRMVEAPGRLHIFVGRYDQRYAGRSITASSAYLLVQSIEGLRHAGMHNSADMRVVDSEAESRGSHYYIQLPLAPPLNDHLTFIIPGLTSNACNAAETALSQPPEPFFGMLSLSDIENGRARQVKDRF